MKKFALNVAGMIFTAVCILHIVRYFKGWKIVFNNFTVPMDWSITGAIIAGLLALLMFIAARK